MIKNSIEKYILRNTPSFLQSIPASAELVFDSSNFKIFRWLQKDFNNKDVYFEKVQLNSSVYIIPITASNKVILAKEKQPGRKTKIGLIGGRVDNNELIIDAALRELNEESNIKPKRIKLIGVSKPYEKIEWIQYYFTVLDFDTVAKETHSSGEQIELIKLSITDFINDLDIGRVDNLFLKSELNIMYAKEGIEKIIKHLSENSLPLTTHSRH